MGVRSAYEKMFEDGSAYKPIKIEQPSPKNEEGRPMGDTGEVDYSLFDQHMEGMIREKVETKKAGGKTKMVNSSTNTKKVNNKEMKSLQRRVDILEQALQLVMETQTKLLRESASNGESIKTEKA